MADQARGTSILVVEDDPDIREALTLALEGEGYAVTATAEGEEALNQLRHSAPPRVILLDLMMPVMDGFEFRVRQKQDPKLAMIPVIVLSGGGDLEAKAAGLDPAACFAKPVDVDQLLEAVAKAA